MKRTIETGRRCGSPRGLRARLVVLALLVAPSTARAQAQPAGDPEPVVEVLLRSLESEPRDFELLESELAQLRPQTPRLLFELLATGAIPAGWLPAGDRPLALDGETLGVLERLLLATDRARLIAVFAGVAEEEPRVAHRDVGVRLLGEVGGAEELRLVVRLAAPLMEGAEVLPRFLRRTFSHALRRIMERDPRATERLVRQFGEIHVGLRSAVVDAYGALDPGTALRFVTRLLGRSPGLDPHILILISRCAGELRHPVEERVRAPVRELLHASDEATVRTAVRAVGLLEDYDAIPTLLVMLAGSDGDLREAAHRSMVSLTGVRLQLGQNAWSRWYAKETRWWDGQRTRDLADLERGDGAAACRALSSIARRRYRRHRLAEQVLEGLGRPEPDVVRLTCRALVALGSPVAEPALVQALTHPSLHLRQHAYGALRDLTGRDLPPEPALWQEALTP